MVFTAKRQISLAFGIIFGLFNLYAQDSGDIEIGANFGLSIASVTTTGENNTNDRVTFNAGISGEYYFSDRWGIKLKLISANKGYSDGSIIDENLNRVITDIELHYITFPVLLNYHFSANRRWNINVGPYLGVLTGAKDSELGIDLKDQVEGTDFGLDIGIGYKIKINEITKLFFDYDGQIGFIDIFKEKHEVLVKNVRTGFNLGLIISI